MPIIVNIKNKMIEEQFVRYIDGKLIAGKENTVIDQVLDTGTPGSGDPGAPGISSILHIRYADDELGNGFTDAQAGKPYAAWKIFNDPAYVPVASDFTGNWFYRLGLPGTSIIASTVDPTDADGQPGWSFINTATQTLFGPKSSATSGAWPPGVSLKAAAGPQGDKGGLGYMLGASNVMDDPGFGWCRFSINTFTVDATGFFAISQKTIGGQLVLDAQKTWAANDRITLQGNENDSLDFIQIEITSREEMDTGLWHKFGFKVIASNALTKLVKYALTHQKVFGLTEVLNNNVARFDSLGNLIDKNGVKVSGIESGTMATLLAKTQSDFNRQYFLVNSGVNAGVRNAGVRFRGTGTEAIADGEQDLYDAHLVFKAIFPHTQATAIATNAGKTKITAVGHLLTTANAVSASEPIAVYISAWTGTGVAGWYNILSRDDADNYTIDLTYAAGLGTPTVALKGTQVVFPFNVPIGKLNDFTKITIEVDAEFTASTNAKNLFTRLNTSEFSAITVNTTNIVNGSYEYGFRNAGAKNKQEVLFDRTLGVALGQSTNLVDKYTEDTSADATLFFRCSCVTADQMIGIRHLTVTRKW